MTKEQIIEILNELQDYVIEVSNDIDFRYSFWKIGSDGIEQVADEILTLHRSEFPMAELVDTGIDVPTDEEIETQSIYNGTSNAIGCQILCQVYWRKGAKWMRDEILKRNK